MAFVNAGAFASQTTSHSSISPALPSSRSTGNVLILVCAARAVNSMTLSGSGWNLISTNVAGSGAVYLTAWRIVDGTEASPTVTYDITTVSTQYAIVYQFSGVTSSPIGATSDNSSVSGTMTATGITTTADSSDVMYVFMDFSTGAIPTPAGWTERADNGLTNAETSMGDKIVTTTGTATGNATATITSGRWAAMQIELISSVIPSGAIVQTLGKIVEAAVGAQWATGVAAQTLKLVTQTASGLADIIGTSTQVLKLITQVAAGAITGTNGAISQTLKLVTQSASGWHSIFGTAAQTLKRVTQSAVGLQWVTGPIVQTLKLIRQSSQGWQEIFGTAAQTLKLVTQHAVAVLGTATHGTIIQTLKLIRQTGLGQQWTTGPIVQTLKLVRQSTQGWHTIFGTAVQLLFRPQQLLNGFELTLDTLFAVSKVQLNAVVAAIEKQIRSTWHGPPDDPLPPLV